MADAAALSSVTVEYATPQGTVRALDAVDARFPRGSSTAIVGRSGSGKSTLVSVLALMRRPTAGTVTIDGADTAQLTGADTAALRSARVGIVFQAFHLDAALSAADNVMLPWFFQTDRGRRRAARRRAEDILESLGVADLATRRPGEMSGGQRQRVAIGRALFSDPVLFVADEPTGNLDEDTAGEVTDTILSLTRRFGTTVVIVTHDRAVAAMADRRLELTRGALTGLAGAA